jgi:hypothetical protein
MAVLFAAACAGVKAQPLPRDGWYASDSLGMVHGPVSGPGDAPWTLELAGPGASHRTTLYKEGVAVRTTVRDYGSSGNIRREAVEEEGILVEESAFDDDGRPLTARRFLVDGSVEETSYAYIDGRLLSRRTSIGGEILETMDYSYAPDGRLVSAKASSGAFQGSGKSASGASSMWRKGPDGLELRLYDASGRLAAVRVYDGTILKSDETRTWAGDVLEHSELVTSDGTKTSTTYAVTGAAAGSILSISVERGGTTVSSDRRSYDDAGRLLRMESETGGRRAVTEYAYDDQGILAVERRFLDPGQLLVIRHESSTDKVEETYREDILIARVAYRDGRRVKEELYKDGIVVRTRTFE